MHTPARLWLAGLSLCLWLCSCGSIGPSPAAQPPRQRTSLETECAPGLILDCETACMNGDHAGCEEAGIGYLEGEVIGQDLQRARMLLSRACEQGLRRACGALGKMAQDGQGVEKAPDEIVRLLSDGCDAGDANACGRLGTLRMLGTGTQRDVTLGRKLLHSACEQGDALSCLHLGRSLVSTTEPQSADPQQAARLFTRACHGNLGKACYELAQLQLQLNQVPPQQAMANLIKACQLRSPAGCGALAERQLQGRGVQKDITAALVNLEMACEGGQMSSCSQLAEVLVSPQAPEPNATRALQLFTQACQADDQAATACHGRGKLLYDGSSGLARDLAAAAAAFERACEHEHEASCGMLGVMQARGHGMAKDQDAAKARVRLGCEQARLDEACRLWGHWLADGGLVKRDAKAARKYLEPLCRRGHAEACQRVGRIDEYGEAGARNPAGAELSYGRACELEHQPGCLAAAVVRWRQRGAASEEAFSLFERRCQQNDAAACHWAALALARGVGTTADPTRSLTLFTQACEAGSQRGCAHRGHLLYLGDTGVKDEKEGRRLIREACDSGNGDGCYLLSLLPETRPEDRRRLRRLACQQHVYDACVALR